MPDFRGLFVYTITKGHQHEADGLFRYLRETMNSATINPKGKITISCIGGRGRRIRTLGTRFWRPLLYQLSYAPILMMPTMRTCTVGISAGAAKQI